MARKSRKPNNKVETQNVKSALIKVAAYVRLSVEDRTRKVTSIENQQLIILDYIVEHPGFELFDTYIDSGVSGTTFDRPEFQRMMRDAEAKIINCIIVKDLSRLGRNAVDTGYYVEKLFPIMGIRLISISDNYDSSNGIGGIILPLTNLVNEIYAFDISRKVRSQKRLAMKDGAYVGGKAPYGYRRSPDNNQKLIMDTPAAETVNLIFSWAANGMSVFEITRKLNALKILSPAAYFAEAGVSNKVKTKSSGIWRRMTVERILKNEIYLGRLIQGKTGGINFMRQPVPSDKWVRVDEAHEAIVSEELFYAAQALINKPKVSRTAYSENIFKVKIYCAHCGSYLERKKNHDKYVYHCVANRFASNSCVGNRIAEDDIKPIVLEQLLQYKDKISDNINEPSVSINIINELRFVEMELSYTQNVTRSLYENLVDGVLNATEYRELKDSYQEKTDALTQRVGELKQMLDDERRKKMNVQKSLRMLNELAESTVLTKEHIAQFVQRIEVFRDGQVYVGLRNF